MATSQTPRGAEIQEDQMFTRTKKSLTALAATAALMAAGATGAQAATFPDYDTVSAQTTGAAASGTVRWNNSFGTSGSWTVRLKDTLADGHCAELYARTRNTRTGQVSSYRKMGQVCRAGESVPFSTSWTGSSPITHLDFKVRRTGVGNSDTYSVSPGGA